jgi:arylsulfatase A-like enzyme
MEPGERSRVIGVARDFYDAAVAHTDRQLGRLLQALERTGLTERTLVVVVSDHGEEFLEHGFTGHALSLYDEVIRVPLVFRQPGRLRAGLRVQEPAGLIDVAPTVLSLAGLAVPETMSGTPLLPHSFSPRPFLLIRRAQDRRTPIEGVPDMDGIALGRFKLIHNLGGAARPEWELFDRLEDPGERNNLAASQPERLASLRELLRERVQRSRRFSPEAAGEPDPESLEKLRGLGYVDELPGG